MAISLFVVKFMMNICNSWSEMANFLLPISVYPSKFGLTYIDNLIYLKIVFGIPNYDMI